MALNIFKKKESKADEKPAEDAGTKPAKAPPKKAETVQKEEAPKSSKPGSYFVSPHPDGGWQVKKAGGQKALKRFKTKAEAEEYAKKVAANQGTSVVRQKKDGKIQKKK